MKKNLLLFLSLLFVSSLLLTSCGEDETPIEKDITVSGILTDDTGAAIAAVNATAVAGTAATTTDAAGAYSITLAEDDRILFEKDGYSSVEEAINSRTSINVSIDRGPSLLFAAYFTSAGNSVTNPGLDVAAGNLKPNASLGALSTPANAFFSTANYKGAVDPNGTTWYSMWTCYENVLAGGNTKSFTAGATVITVTDDLMKVAGNVVNWTKDKTYILDGLVFVNDGQTLNIEAGTIIKGKPGEAENSSALIVARGGKIMAEGTAAEPIIFTFENDNGSGQSPTLRGQWGGLIVLGKAGLNSNPGESAIEGIPTTEVRGLYGGTDNADNSGVIKYVSIRHGGTNIGNDNEINGLTLGGVGSGTVIDYVEIIANKDDGIEWFGGTAQAKHLLSIFCGDDGFDYDEGFRGMVQFGIIHQDPTADAADRGGEHDGGTDPETGTPYAIPVFVNITSIGNPGSRTITFRDNAGGQYHNSIFINYGKGIDIEDLKDQNQDVESL